MIRCLAIDDEPLALRQLATYIKKIPFLELVEACQSALDARKIMEEEMIDAIFVDINMPDLNGMDFVKSRCHRLSAQAIRPGRPKTRGQQGEETIRVAQHDTHNAPAGR